MKVFEGSFRSGGVEVGYECYDPELAAVAPTVVILHGSGGMEWGRTLFVQNAKMLARRGILAYILHYFDRTSDKASDHRKNIENFGVWLETLRDFLAYIKLQPAVDSDRIGLLGFSLGAYLAISCDDPEVRAVVDVFGGLSEQYPPKYLRPTLILHGDSDPIVPVEEAYRLEKRLKEAGVEYERHIFPGQGHNFEGSAGRQALLSTLSFLQKRLQRCSA